MFNCVYEGRTPLHHRSFSLNTASSIPELFLCLKDFFSFFNYQIIEHIKALGTEEDKAQLQRYKDDLINMQREESLNAHQSLEQ